MKVRLDTYPSNINVFLETETESVNSFSIDTDGIEIDDRDELKDVVNIDIDNIKEKFDIKSFENESDIREELEVYYDRFIKE